MKGHAAYIRYERQGVGKRARLVRRRYEEDFDRSFPMSLTARRQVLGFGFTDLLDHYRSTEPPKVRLTEIGQDDWRKAHLNVLAPEFDEVEAASKVAEDAVDAIRNEYKDKGHELEFFTAEVGQVRGLKLTFLPVWNVTYAFKGSLFQALHAGWDASPVVATEPVLMFRRIAYVLGSLLASLMGGLATILLAQNYLEFGLILFGVATLLGLGLGRRLTADIRIEGRRRRWL